MNCRTRCGTSLGETWTTSEDVDVLPHPAHAVALHSLVGQLEVLAPSPPPEATSAALLTTLAERGCAEAFAAGGLEGGAADDEEVVEGAEGVGDSGVLLVDQELAAVTEFEFVGPVSGKVQINDAA